MMDAFLNWWPVLLVIVQGVLAWVLWSMRHQFVLQDEFESYKTDHDTDHGEIDAKLAAGKNQFTRIESELKHLPNRGDIDELKAQLHQVDKGLVRLTGSVNVVAAKLGAVEKPVDLMMRHAIEDDN
ncbi:conserved protein of unknown function (Bacteriophage Mu, Gp25 5-119) [Magnetospirillum sp. XM-1]|uniref:hypothetical protein n=1 Tax=Magnetospirillum sp. XM-1 TaxID=1663591 RepID=UPI00073DF947|nr:hypothetical protein [Magnetospirillum sp. XM-1]CUW41126.1 conserved protein of unknown function (Bacteriophage Mu, Gp25 5-119) [Magnetospirillum sp. XM-1]